MKPSFTMWLIRSPSLPSEHALHPIHLPFFSRGGPLRDKPVSARREVPSSGNRLQLLLPTRIRWGELWDRWATFAHTHPHKHTHSLLPCRCTRTHTCAALFWVAFLFFLLFLSICLQWIDFLSLLNNRADAFPGHIVKSIDLYLADATHTWTLWSCWRRDFDCWICSSPGFLLFFWLTLLGLHDFISRKPENRSALMSHYHRLRANFIALLMILFSSTLSCRAMKSGSFRLNVRLIFQSSLCLRPF